jgi:hypothetical protein
MKQNNIFCLYFMILLFANQLSAQLQQFQKPDPTLLSINKKSVEDTIHHFKVIAKYTSEGIKLRWAPVNEEFWRSYNKGGFIIQRYSYDTLGFTDKDLVQISDTIRPWSFNKCKDYLTKTKDEPYVAVVAQNLYSKTPKESYKEWTDYTDDLQNRYAFTLLAAEYSPKAAEAAALGCTDNDVKKDRFYHYRVIGIRDSINSLDTFDVYLQTFEMEELMTPVLEEPFSEDKLMGFSWNRLAHSKFYTGYFIERSEDGKTFTVLNKTPYINAISNTLPQDDRWIKWNDKNIINYKKYYYRIKGITPYGEVGPPSNILILQGLDKTPPVAPNNVKAEHLGGKKVKISWEHSGKEGDLAGFMIGRSRKANESFENISGALPLNKKVHFFIDTACIESTTNFYIVAAVDTAKNAAASLVSYAAILDSVPPSKPKGLMGSIDTNGIVTLHWPLGMEADIKGYFVWSTNAGDHVFINLTPTPIQDTIWRDTISLKTLTKEIFYKIQAVDRMSNSSVYSDPVRLIKPDIVPPVAPVITDFKNIPDKVLLSWQNSTSPDVAYHQVLRRSTLDTNWIALAKINLGQPSNYTDHKTLKNHTYQYTVTAVDSRGNISDKARPLDIKTQKDLNNPIIDFAPKSDTLQKVVTLQWTDIPEVPYKEIIIYKATDKGAVKSLARIKKKEDQSLNIFRDRNVSNNKVYEYTCKVVYNKGLTSNFSPLIEIKTNK